MRRRAEPPRLSEGGLGPAHASWLRRHGQVLDRHSGLLPPIPELERVERRLPASDGTGLRQRPELVLRAVAQTSGHPQADRHLALRRDGKGHRTRHPANPQWSALPPADRNRHHGCAGGQLRVEPVELTSAQGRFTIAAAAEPQSVVLDPNTWLLVESADFVRQ